DLDRLFAQIQSEKGRLDIEFANAGVATYALQIPDRPRNWKREPHRRTTPNFAPTQWSSVEAPFLTAERGLRRSMIIGMPNRGRSVIRGHGSALCPGVT